MAPPDARFSAAGFRAALKGSQEAIRSTAAEILAHYGESQPTDDDIAIASDLNFDVEGLVRLWFGDSGDPVDDGENEGH